MRVLAQARGLDAVENLHEQRDVAVDEVEARLVRFAAQAGGDEEEVAVRGASVIARVNFLVAGERAAVQEVERLAFGHVLVGVEDLQLGHEAAALQRKRRAGTHAAAAADDGDFHNF